MTVFEKLKATTIDGIVDWLDKYMECDDAPWFRWWVNKYCHQCFGEEFERAWCELHGNCKFFQNMSEIPNSKETIKMWLESESE